MPKEKNFQSDFSAWVKSHLDTFSTSCAFELKIWKCDKSKAFPLNSVKPHQLEGLAAASGYGLYHKISDSPWGRNEFHRFTSKKPLDCFLIKNAKAFVVIYAYFKGQRKDDRRCYMIPLDGWLRMAVECARIKRKSITLDMLKSNSVPLNIW
jgi:penicillin-binding protein-related factor A (putative recombinase)